MKLKYAAAVAGALALSGCAVKTMSNMNINTDEIQYKQDDRTGLCFAFVAVGKGIRVVPEGLGMTHVPCSPKVLALVK